MGTFLGDGSFPNANSSPIYNISCNEVIKNIGTKIDLSTYKFSIIEDKRFVDKKFTAYQGYDQKIKQGTYLNDKVVIDGNIVTSRGPATAYGFAYKLVELLGGDALVVKKRMVYFNAFDVKEDE